MPATEVILLPPISNTLSHHEEQQQLYKVVYAQEARAQMELMLLVLLFETPTDLTTPKSGCFICATHDRAQNSHYAV